MTSSDDAAAAGAQMKSGPLAIVILSLLGFASIFCAGVVVGFFAAAFKSSPAPQDWMTGALLLAIAALCAWQFVVRANRLVRKTPEPLGPSARKVRRLWTFFVTLGLLLGGLVGFLTLSTTHGNAKVLIGTLYSNAPVSPLIAIVLLTGLALMCIGTVFYYRYIDEHDRAAQETASLIAFNAYIILVMGWWIAAKGQLVTPVDHGAIFLTVMIIWTAVWLWRRYA